MTRQRGWLWTGRAVDVGGIYLKGLEERQKLNAAPLGSLGPLTRTSAAHLRAALPEGCFAPALPDGTLLHVSLVMPWLHLCGCVPPGCSKITLYQWRFPPSPCPGSGEFTQSQGQWPFRHQSSQVSIRPICYPDPMLSICFLPLVPQGWGFFALPVTFFGGAGIIQLLGCENE